MKYCEHACHLYHRLICPASDRFRVCLFQHFPAQMRAMIGRSYNGANVELEKVLSSKRRGGMVWMVWVRIKDYILKLSVTYSVDLRISSICQYLLIFVARHWSSLTTLTCLDLAGPGHPRPQLALEILE